MKKIILFIFIGLLIFNCSSNAFSLKKILRETSSEKNKTTDQNKTDAASDTSAAAQSGESDKKTGWLLDMGRNLGLKEKDLKVIDAGAGLLKSQVEITKEEELEIGGSLALEVVARYGGKYKNEKVNEYVNLVGLTLVKYCDYVDIPYKFLVLDSEEINAFAAPGGYVFITKGLFYSLSSEAQLAGILAHEIAHITQKHILKTLKRGKLLENLTKLTATLSKSNVEKYTQIMSEVNSTLFEKGVDQTMEYEADRIAVEYVYRTGYNPNGLLEFVKYLQNNIGSKKSVFFSTHPNINQRIEKLEKEVLPNYPVGGQVLADRLKKYLE
ncbi:MAG TPA: M48 family metalloprotease [bacterium]|nr:M48 family metalloprotease [bacterium]HPP88328.1 M48 family metalloprotease [bacterium]